MKSAPPVALEARTARLTILIDPRKKAVFDKLCAGEDSTPSQVVRRLIRAYIEQRLGPKWSAASRTATAARPATRPVTRPAATVRAGRAPRGAARVR
jgi:hypothetical protein